VIQPAPRWLRRGAAPPHLFIDPAGGTLAMLSWVAAVAVSFIVLAAVSFTSGDPDSRVYAGIAARLAAEPFARWIAPEWWGQWGFSGPFREHPIGIFLVPALFGKAGYPAQQAAYAVNGAFQVASIVLVQMLAVRFAAAREARALGWMVQLMPIAFVFRVRANQEYAVLAGILLALVATERSRERVAWASLTAVGFAWALLVKGVFGFVVPVVCAVWLAARAWTHSPDGGLHVGPGLQSRPRRLAPWIALALVLLVAPALTLAYERAYVSATGESFLAFYIGPRLNPEAVTAGSPGRLAYNIIWYTARLAWYAFPWSLIALGAFGAALRRYVGQRYRLRVKRRRTAEALSASAPSAPARPRRSSESAVGAEAVSAADRRDSRSAGSGVLFAVVASFVLIVLFSFSDRKADRFIFPAYYFMAAAGGVTAVRCWPAVSHVVDRLDRPWVPAVCWLSLFALRLVTGSHLPQFTFWRS
jgi:4-amino-4-deoxy-L-arabinose transferase-like glycosyltransferase